MIDSPLVVCLYPLLLLKIKGFLCQENIIEGFNTKKELIF